jgi:hypothetical protein
VVILVDVLAVTTASTPLKNTLLSAKVGLKSVPVIVTTVPATPDVGENEVMVGAGPQVTVKSESAEVSEHPLYTLMGPVVAPAGTLVVIVVAELAVTMAETPLNCTIFSEGVVLKFVPVIVTASPSSPVEGANNVMVG